MVQPIGTHTDRRLYEALLRLNYGREGAIVWDPDYASLSDPELWDRVRRDPVVVSALELRVARVAGTEARAIPGGPSERDQVLADCFQDSMEEIQDWVEVRIKAAEAVARGSSWGWIDWADRYIDVGGLGTMRWRVPIAIHDVDRRRFEQRILCGRPVWHLYSIERDAWEPLEASALSNFLRLIYRNTEDALGYGRGLLEAVYHYQYFRTQLLKRFLAWADREAFGHLVAKLAGIRRGSSSNATLAAQWEAVLEKMRRKHVTVADAEDDIQLITGGEAGASAVIQGITYCDNAITHLLQGGHLQTGALAGGDAGSLAQAEVHRQSGGDLVSRDQAKLCGSIRRDLVGQWRRLNAPQLTALGLGGAKSPKITTEPEETEDIHASVADAGQLLDRGVPLLAEDLYTRTGWKAPTEEDLRTPGRVIRVEPRAPEPAMFRAGKELWGGQRPTW